MQTAEHGLFTCEAVRPAWETLQDLLKRSHYNMPLFNWHNVLYGNLGRPQARGPGPGMIDLEEDITWDAWTSCSINSGTPWLVIRYALLWYLWCQHYEHDLCEGVFHIGVALYKARQCTVQVGMAAWRQLQRFRKKCDPSKHADMESAFITIWCQRSILCVNKGGKPSWIPTLHHDFLTRDFANHFALIRIHRTDVDDKVSQPSNSTQSSSRNSVDRIFRDALHSRVQTEVDDLAEAIIDQLIANLEEEVELEDLGKDTPTPRAIPPTDQPLLPDEILSPRFLRSQNSVWSNSA